MPDDDDVELDQLLARGRLSGRQYDEIGRRVLARVAPPKSVRWPLFALLPAAALVAGLVFVGRSTSVRSDEGSPIAARDEFTARGSSAANADAPYTTAIVDVGCAGRPAHVCQLGDTLMFSVNNSQTSGYLLAFAERVAEPSVRIWYFPASDGTAPSVEARAATTVLSQGVRLGPPHAVGQYRVMAWLSAAPANEAQALEQYERMRVTPVALEIVE